jgi:ABC-2 type transport system permease protein
MWKEFLEIGRDRLFLPLIFLMPVLQLILFGYVVGTDVRDLPMVVVDHDLTPTSRQVVTAFQNSGYFTVVGHTDRESDMRTLLDANRAQVALLIPQGFGEQVLRAAAAPVEVVVDGSESKSASVAQGYAVAILGELDRKLVKRPPGVDALAIPSIDARIRVLFNPSLRSINTMVPGLIAFILLLSTTMLMSQAVVKERERGTLEQIFVTPISRAEYLLGKVLPYTIIASAQISVIFIVGTMWFGVPFNGSLLVIGAGAVLFLLTCLGQGLIVSTVSRTRYQAQMGTIFIVIPSFLLSGFVFPLESMPPAVYAVTHLIPLRYFLVILRSNFMKGAGFVPLAPQFAAMAVFAVVIFGFALGRFRKKLED